MAWGFRKRIKLIPGVHLNLSKSGISTSIGVKGASVTFGKYGNREFFNIKLAVYKREGITLPSPEILTHQAEMSHFIEYHLMSD